MHKLCVPAAILLFLVAGLWPLAGQAQRYSDEEVRQIIIRDSLAGFGSTDCPCPYSYAWNGQQCNDKALYYKRTGRRDIFCYPADVSYRDIEDYRRLRELRR